jgi:hypothetical protein
MHTYYIGIKHFFSHKIQRKTQIIFSLYLVFEEKTIVQSLKNHSKCIRSCHFPIYKIYLSDPTNWVLNFDKKNIEKNQKCAYYNNNLEKKTNFDKTPFKKDLHNEEEGLYKIYIKEVCGKFL